MLKNIIFAFPIAVFFHLTFTIPTFGQCVQCDFSSQIGACETKLVNESGSTSCTCSSGGCSCSGLCSFKPQPIEKPIEFFSDLDSRKFVIPTKGLMFELEDYQENKLDEYFNSMKFTPHNLIPQIYVGHFHAFYKVDVNKYVIFPIKDEKLNIYDCNGVKIFTSNLNNS